MSEKYWWMSGKTSAVFYRSLSCFDQVIYGAPQAGSCGGAERLRVLKEGLCEAGSWLAVEGRVIVRNWVATAAQYLWLNVGGRRLQSSLDETQTVSPRRQGPSVRPPHMEHTGLMRTGEATSCCSPAPREPGCLQNPTAHSL